MSRVSVFVVLLIAALSCTGAGPATAEPAPVIGTVYVFRPMGGRLATPEMDKLARRIEERGLEAEVHPYADWIRPAKAAIDRYKAETWKSAIIVVGHSAGGDSSIRFARWLRRAGVPVDLIITLDPTRIANTVPGNVERFVNVYSSGRALGSGDPKPDRDFKGYFASVDLSDFAVLHRYLPGIGGLQESVVNKVAAVAEQPDPPPTTAVPIAYQIPKGSPIILWDTGMPVSAEAGETAASIAARYGVPAWAVAAINDVDPHEQLTPGRRLVVPSHLSTEAR